MKRKKTLKRCIGYLVTGIIGIIESFVKSSNAINGILLSLIIVLVVSVGLLIVWSGKIINDYLVSA